MMSGSQHTIRRFTEAPCTSGLHATPASPPVSRMPTELSHPHLVTSFVSHPVSCYHPVVLLSGTPVIPLLTPMHSLAVRQRHFYDTISSSTTVTTASAAPAASAKAITLMFLLCGFGGLGGLGVWGVLWFPGFVGVLVLLCLDVKI